MNFRLISTAFVGLALSFSALADTPAVSTVKQVQERLVQLGFYSGPIDGDLSGDAQAALTQFQMSELLPASGGLDDATLKALGVQRQRDPSAGAGATAPSQESTSSESLPNDAPDKLTVKLVQEQLTRLGFYSGLIDGDLSGDAQAALTQFQISELLPASGGLDDDTLKALGVERPRERSAAAGGSAPGASPEQNVKVD